MRILLLCHSFNSLTQRLHVELGEAGHRVSVEFDVNDSLSREAVQLFRPDLVVAPFLKRAIAEDVWRAVRCLIVHPGIRGDKGPNALDWAILEDAPRWGVTLIEARAEMDAGPVWAWREFPMRKATKASLYRREVAEAAVACVFETIARLEAGETRGAGADQRRTGPCAPRMRRRRAAHRFRTLHARRGAAHISGERRVSRGASKFVWRGMAHLRSFAGPRVCRPCRRAAGAVRLRRSLSRSRTARCGSATPSGRERAK